MKNMISFGCLGNDIRNRTHRCGRQDPILIVGPQGWLAQLGVFAWSLGARTGYLGSIAVVILLNLNYAPCYCHCNSLSDLICTVYTYTVVNITERLFVVLAVLVIVLAV